MAKKSNFIDGAFKETAELMKRFLNTVQSEYKTFLLQKNQNNQCPDRMH